MAQHPDPVQDYLREVDAVPALTPDEESALWVAVNGGDGSHAAKKRLIRATLRSVIPIARRYEGRGVGFADLLQEGNVALTRAVERYDRSQGPDFVTYAEERVDAAIAAVIG